LTASDVHINFKFRLDKADALNYPNIEPEEIDLLATQAQVRYIKQRYGITNTKRTSFEETQKRTEDLKAILENVVLSNLVKNNENIDYNSVFVQLPNNHWFTIHERAIINCPSCNENITVVTNPLGENPTTEVIQGISVLVKPLQHVDFDVTYSDPFKGPDNTKILRLMYKNYAELLLPNNCTLPYYNLRYIRKPLDFSLASNQTFELSEHTHDEIVDMMVDIALENIEAKRLQSYNKIINTNE